MKAKIKIHGLNVLVVILVTALMVVGIGFSSSMAQTQNAVTQPTAITLTPTATLVPTQGTASLFKIVIQGQSTNWRVFVIKNGVSVHTITFVRPDGRIWTIQNMAGWTSDQLNIISKAAAELTK